MTKKCCHCKQEKPIENFTKDRRAKDGLQSRCGGCAYFWQARDYAARPEFYRYKRIQRVLKDPEKAKRESHRYQLKFRYGLTVERYEKMLTEQAGKCKICGVEMKPVCVDHDKETGEVWGLLCNICNRGIGYLKHSIPNLQAAILYLSRTETRANVPNE